MGRMESPYDPELESLREYTERMHKDCLKARHLGMELDFGRLQLKLDKAEIIYQLADYSEPEARELMKTMLCDTLDASRPTTISIDARRDIDRRMHALMELFADKGMNQEFVRIRQSEEREPVASPPPARLHGLRRQEYRQDTGVGSVPPKQESEEPVIEVKTPGVMAAEAAQAAGAQAQEAFLKQQMGVLEVMKDTLLSKLGGTGGKASTIKISDSYSGLAHAAGIRF